jgi:hypothetical protein
VHVSESEAGGNEELSRADDGNEKEMLTKQIAGGAGSSSGVEGVIRRHQSRSWAMQEHCTTRRTGLVSYEHATADKNNLMGNLKARGRCPKGGVYGRGAQRERDAAEHGHDYSERVLSHLLRLFVV